MTSGRLRVGQLGAIAVAMAAAGAGFSASIPGNDLIAPVAGAALLPVGLAWALRAVRRGTRAGAPRREPPVAISVAAGAAALALACLGEVARAGHGAGLRTLPAAFSRAWADVLAGSPPAGQARTEAILVPLVLLWLCSFLAAELACRCPDRRLPLLPLLPLGAADVVSHLFGGALPAIHPKLFEGIFVAAAGFVVVLRTHTGAEAGPATRSGRDRRIVAAGSIVAVTAVAAPFLGAMVPRGHLGVPRAAPAAPTSSASPLPSASPSLSPPSTGPTLSPAPLDLFSVSSPPVATGAGQGAIAEPRLQLGVVDHFEGGLWAGPTRATAWEPVAAMPGPAGGVGGTLVRQVITVDELPGYLLPSVSTPAAVSAGGAGLVYDPSTGALADLAGVHPGLTYALRDAAAPSSRALAGAQAMTGPQAAPFLALPPALPPMFKSLAESATAKATSGVDRALDLQAFFEQGGFASSGMAQWGDAAGELDAFAAGGPATSDHRAAAYALMARTIGLPSRVVLGVTAPAPGGTLTVTSSDLSVWPEVWFASDGWVPVDPLPAGGSAPLSSLVEANASLGEGAAGGAASTNPSPSVPAGAAHRSAWWLPAALLLLAAGVALMMVAGAGVVAAKRIRRRRRRRGPPAVRVLGAWREALGRLIQRGLQPVASGTASEVASAAEGVLGQSCPEVAHLADLLNGALYAGSEPGAGEAEEAWACLEALEETLAQRARVGTRVREAVDPRPLLRSQR